MTYETFNRSMDLLKAWRVRNNLDDNIWPDSRHPDIKDLLVEFKVVSQDLEKSIIALAAFRHNYGGVYQNISAVAKVIVNRQNKGLFRSHTTDKDQFPYMALFEEDLGVYPTKDFTTEKFLENLDDILDSKVVDITQGACWFGKIDENISDWFRNIVNDPTKERTVKIDEVTFFRDKK